MENKSLTGFPSIDRPWLKYYDEKAINAELPHMSMYDYLYECSKDYLDTTALNYFGRKFTYRKMFENIDRVAVALQANGVKKGDIVTVCTLTAPETVYLIYAINKVGAISNMVGLTSPVHDLHEQISSTESKLVFVVEMAYDLIVQASKDTNVEKIVSIPIEYSMPTLMKAAASLKQKHPQLQENSVKWADFLESGKNAQFTPVEFDSADMALILYTGGSTGIPKGVMISSNAANAYYVNIHNTNSRGLLFFKPGESFLCCVPLFLVFGLIVALHGTLLLKLEVILCPDPSPTAVSEVFFKLKPNYLCAGIIHLEEIKKAVIKNNVDLSFLVTALYGGEKVQDSWENDINKCYRAHGYQYSLLN